MAEFRIGRLKYTWRGDWSSGNVYFPDEIVSYGGKVYVCLREHNSESGGGFYGDLAATVPGTVPPEPAPRWEQMMDGYAWQGDWQAEIPYSLNDLVKYGGIVYRCNLQHTSDNLLGIDSTLVDEYGLENDQASWTIIAKTEDWKLDWIINQPYRVNDIVKYGGIVYRCITAHISAITISLGLEADQAKWEIVHSGIEYRFEWTTPTRYRINDVVKYGARAYICTTYHDASGLFDSSKWTVYAPGLEYDNQWDTITRYQIGDVIKYGGYSYFALTFNQASVPSTSPSDWELLSIGYNLRGDYSSLTSYLIGDVVRRNGNLYACIVNSTNNDPTNTAYWEVVTTSKKWRNRWILDTAYELGDIITFDLFAYECVQRHTSTALLRPDFPAAASYWSLFSQGDLNNRLRDQGDLKVYGITEDGSTIGSTRLAIGSTNEVLKRINDLPDWYNLNETTAVYYVSTDGIDAAGRGVTLNSPWRTVRYACQNITGPATILIKTGYYEEILPISIPAGVALVGDELRGTTIGPAAGYESSNMFYVRNACGIRNMTLTGLSGSLGALNQYLTRRPTGGAYVSLDPGTGTNDTSVWISSRSPYIQNVTTFGSGCVGLKVDGNLHDGGNRSIVANDFTQVLSDGIGAWVTNLGRSELVSVFSYYGHIGYLAENGGKIRATNGNSSYGTYGCVAEGVSLAEIPITGNVNNRSTEATVASAFSDQAGDQILILEYEHCGQEYSSGGTTYTFVGAGTGASATAVTRDGGVSQVRIYTPGDSSQSGGGGYLNVINNAQAGDEYSITLAVSDSNTFANYQDMRLVINSGTGSGQYGRIAAYDSTTKIAHIAQEQTGSIAIVASSSSTNQLEAGLGGNGYGNTSWSISPPQPVVFTGTTFGGILPHTTYLISNIVSGPTTDYYELTDLSATPITLSDDTGTMYMHFVGYNHVAGFVAEPTLDTTTQYSIEPRVVFDEPASGIRAQGRANIVAGKVTLIKIWDCGSGYTVAPTVTLTDPNNTSNAVLQARINNGVLGPVNWVSRGNNYQTTSTRVTISGGGLADKYQLGDTLVLLNLSRLPGPGDNLTIAGINDVIYKVIAVENVSGSVPSISATLTISPNLGIEESPAHNTPIIIRQNYSQCRLTGHDFLDIGTGNFVGTDYPDLYKEYGFTPAPENEVYEAGGGRVFYTSTDQDGNFRVGELFKVEQATGSVTISASLFNLGGLEELRLGGVAVGGTGTVIREFSTDSTFTADSNNIVSTQRAIKAYITSRISGGSSDAFTTILTAGIVVAGPNLITTTTGDRIHIGAPVKFNSPPSGSMLAMSYFANSWDSDLGYQE
jgi:hypothetical protein